MSFCCLSAALLIPSGSHINRLRKLTGHQAGSQQDYSKEELIAEMGASFLSGCAGIFDAPQLEQAAAYIQNWIKVLKNDSRMVIQAASAAQKAADYITGGV